MVGHILWRGSLLTTIIEGDVEGRIGRGQNTLNYQDLKVLSNNREARRATTT